MDRRLADRSQPRRGVEEESAEEVQEDVEEEAEGIIDEVRSRQRGGGSAEAASDELPRPSHVAAEEGTQGTQVIPATQLPDPNTLPSFEEAHSTYIPTHKWPPKAVRPELSRTLTSLWQKMANNPHCSPWCKKRGGFWRGNFKK